MNFIFSSFSDGNEDLLRVKWVHEPKQKCLEGKYVICLEEKLGYKLDYNMKKGDTCPCND